MNEWYTDNGTSFSSFYKYYPDRNNTLVRIRLATDRSRQQGLDTGDPSIFVTPNTFVFSGPRPHSSFSDFIFSNFYNTINAYSNIYGFYPGIFNNGAHPGNFMFDVTMLHFRRITREEYHNIYGNRVDEYGVASNYLDERFDRFEMPNIMTCPRVNVHHGDIITTEARSLPQGIYKPQFIELADLAIQGVDLPGLEHQNVENGDTIYRFRNVNNDTLSGMIKQAIGKPDSLFSYEVG